MNAADYAISFVGALIALVGMAALLEDKIVVAMMCALLAWLGVVHTEWSQS